MQRRPNRQRLQLHAVEALRPRWREALFGDSGAQQGIRDEWHVLRGRCRKTDDAETVSERCRETVEMIQRRKPGHR